MDDEEVRERLDQIESKLDRLMPLADLMAQLGNGEGGSPLKMIAALMRGGS